MDGLPSYYEGQTVEVELSSPDLLGYIVKLIGDEGEREDFRSIARINYFQLLPPVPVAPPRPTVRPPQREVNGKGFPEIAASRGKRALLAEGQGLIRDPHYGIKLYEGVSVLLLAACHCGLTLAVSGLETRLPVWLRYRTDLC